MHHRNTRHKKQGKLCGGRGVMWELFVHSDQVFCKPKIAVKKSQVYQEKQKR